MKRKTTERSNDKIAEEQVEKGGRKGINLPRTQEIQLNSGIKLLTTDLFQTSSVLPLRHCNL